MSISRMWSAGKVICHSSDLCERLLLWSYLFLRYRLPTLREYYAVAIACPVYVPNRYKWWFLFIVHIMLKFEKKLRAGWRFTCSFSFRGSYENNQIIIAFENTTIYVSNPFAYNSYLTNVNLSRWNYLQTN